MVSAINKLVATFALAAAVMVATAPAHAVTYTYVGSWEVDQGPSWAAIPPAYTGQEAAALLFGGGPSDYVISTVDRNPAHINFDNWVSTNAGGACGTDIN